MFHAWITSVYTYLVAEQLEHPSTLAIRVAVKLSGIVEIVALDWLVPEVAALEPLAGARPTLVIGLILAIVRLGPDGLQKCGEALVEPDVAPILASDEIAEPLVAEFVGDQVVLAGDILGSGLGLNDATARVRRSAGIFHAAGDEIVHHHLVVFFPRIVNAKFLAEEFH